MIKIDTRDLDEQIEVLLGAFDERRVKRALKQSVNRQVKNQLRTKFAKHISAQIGVKPKDAKERLHFFADRSRNSARAGITTSAAAAVFTPITRRRRYAAIRPAAALRGARPRGGITVVGKHGKTQSHPRAFFNPRTGLLLQRKGAARRPLQAVRLRGNIVDEYASPALIKIIKMTQEEVIRETYYLLRKAQKR